MRNIIIFSLLLFASSTSLAADQLADVSVASQTARPSAPDFVLEKLHGGKARLADYKGKVILLNFWATWCVPCRVEMPGMETVWQKYKDQGFLILAVSVDEGSRERVETFSRIMNLSFPILLDPDSEVSDLYQVSTMPTSFLIDANGKISSRIIGTEEWSSPESIKLVEDLLSSVNID